MFLCKISAVSGGKVKSPSFDDSLKYVMHSIQLGSFFSTSPLSAKLPTPKGKNQYEEAIIPHCEAWIHQMAPAFPLRESQIPELVSSCYPNADEDKLTAALICISGLFLYDDYIDKLLQTQDDFATSLREKQVMMHHAFAHPEAYSKKTGIPPFVKMVAEMGHHLKMALALEFLPSVHAAFSGYLNAMVDETQIRADFVRAYSSGNLTAVLETNELNFLRLRSHSSGVEFVFSLCAAFEDFSLGGLASLRLMIPAVNSAILSCGDAIGVFNDITTLRKDLLEGLTENIVLIVAEKIFFKETSVLNQLDSEDIRKILFYRDLATISALNESLEKLEPALKAIEKKYDIKLPSEMQSLFLTLDHDAFLNAIEARLHQDVSFNETIFSPWISALQSALIETTDKYYNKEVTSFYKSINSCQEASKTDPSQFSKGLLQYFDNLEIWLSGSSWWSINPKNERYNWWMHLNP